MCLNNIITKNRIMNNKQISFENELILHLLTQKHLKKLFDIKCVASEIQLNNLRLDNLAYDEKANAFVIIEYKNRFSANVLSQAQDYYNLVLKNKKFFLKRLKNPKNVNFDNTRVMIISPKFSKKQIRQTKSNFELWWVSLYEDLHIEYRQLKTGHKRTLKVEEDDLRLSEEDLLKNKSDEIIELYHTLMDCIAEKFKNIGYKILVDEISFNANGKLICNVKFLKKSFNAYFHATELVDEKQKLRDISNKGTGGKANYEFKLNSKRDLKYFTSLFKQSYDMKVNCNE